MTANRDFIGCARAVATTLCLASIVGCVDKATAPRAPYAMLRVETAIGAQIAPATAVDVFVGYAQTGGVRIELLKHRELIAPGTQEVSVQVDLTDCLDDPARPAPLDVCVLIVDVVLRDENDLALDSVRTSPVTAIPGQNVSAPNVELTAGVSVEASFCTGAHGVVFAAFQDGTGAWQPIPLANGVGTFRIKTGRGGVTYVSPSPAGGWTVSTIYAASSEITTGAAFFCQTPTGSATITGSVANLGTFGYAYVTLGGAVATIVAPTATFSLQSVADGLHDLIATRHTFNGSVLTPTSVVVRRNVSVLGSATLTPIDFSTGTAPESYPLTVVGAAGDSAFTLSQVVTSNRKSGGLVSAIPSNGSWYAVPASLRIAGDLNLAIVSTTAPGDPGASRIALITAATPGPRVLTLGPTLAAPTISTIATQPYVRFRASVAVQPEYAQLQSFFASQGTGTATRSTAVQVTQAYRQLVPGVAVEVPDLSGVAGWSNDWGVKPAISTSWTMSAITITNAQLFRGYVDGGGQISASRTGTITP